MRIIRHRLNNRILSASIVIVLCVLIVGLIPVRDVFAAGMEVSLPYEQTWTNDSGKNVDNTFDYRMTAADAKSPMPTESSGGTYDFSITGETSGKKVLHFAFGKPGYYHYKVTPMTGGLSELYTYDPQVYDLTIMIINGDGELKVGAMTIQDKDLAKYSALEYNAEYSEPEQDVPDDNGGGRPANNGGGAPADGGGGVAPADGGVTPADGGNNGEPGDEIDDNPVPLEPDAGIDYWALLNLILMILTVIIAIADGILYFRNPDDEDEEEENPEGDTQDGSAGSLSATSAGIGGTGGPGGAGDSDEEEAEEDDVRKHGLVRILALIVAIISIIVFFLTEDMRLPMEWVDEYTIWMVILFIIEIILAFLSRKTWDEEDEDADEENAENAAEEETG